MLTADVKEYIDRSVLCWLGTVNNAGMPNVSPKEVFCVYGDSHFIIANIASPNSILNLKSNKNACVSFIDVFVQKGFKLYGQATIVEPLDPLFLELVKPLLEMTKSMFVIHNIISLYIEEVHQIIAPSYLYVRGTTEESQVTNAMKTYGVIRKV